MATNGHFKQLGEMEMGQYSLFVGYVGAPEYADRIINDEVAERAAELDSTGSSIGKEQYFQGQLAGFGSAILEAANPTSSVGSNPELNTSKE